MRTCCAKFEPLKFLFSEIAVGNKDLNVSEIKDEYLDNLDAFTKQDEHSDRT